MPPHFTAAHPDDVKEIECAICLEPWDKPVELQPCRHVFCKHCCQALTTCPDCRQAIRGRKDPNRILVNISEGAVLRCEGCAWTGSREASRSHRCGSGGAGPSPPAAAHHQPPPPAQRQHQHHQPRPMPPPPASSHRPPQHHGAHMLASPPPPSDQPWLAYGLDQAEYDHIFAVFLTFDTDGSGELDRRELTTLCRWLNYAHTDRDIDTMFRAMDTDGSGALSMDEFCRWVSTHRPDPQALYGLTPIQYNEVLFQFHTFDKDQNGTLDEEEFIGLALRQAYAASPVDARNLFRVIDIDRSGAIDLHELLTFRAQRAGHRSPQPTPQPVAPQHQPWAVPQQQPPPQHQEQQAWQQMYPAPAPHGEQHRYQGSHPAPQPGWQQHQQQQSPQGYPTAPGYQAVPGYNPSQPYPQAPPAPVPAPDADDPHHHGGSKRRKDGKKDCVVQ